jgi:hypothetical protein
MLPDNNVGALGSMPDKKLDSVTSYGCSGESPVQLTVIFSPAEALMTNGNRLPLKVPRGPVADAAPPGAVDSTTPTTATGSTIYRTARHYLAIRHRTIPMLPAVQSVRYPPGWVPMPAVKQSFGMEALEFHPGRHLCSESVVVDQSGGSGPVSVSGGQSRRSPSSTASAGGRAHDPQVRAD